MRSKGDPATSWRHTSRSPSMNSSRVKSARTALPRGEPSTVVHASGVASSTRVTPGHQRRSCSGSPTTLQTSSGVAAKTVSRRRSIYSEW